MDARRAIGWLASQGYERIGILGTSLGSCLSLLTAAHEPGCAPRHSTTSRRTSPTSCGGAFNHARTGGLEGAVDLERLERNVAADQPAGLPRSVRARRPCWSMRWLTLKFTAPDTVALALAMVRSRNVVVVLPPIL